MTSGWAAKRFWAAATAAPCDGGYTVHLDTRPLRTPAKAPLVVPTMALAAEIAAEWNAQSGKVRPETMPFTRTANSAIDKLSVQRAEVVALLAAYGASDLLCYRADQPAALVDRQTAAWDPLLHWAATGLHAPLAVTAGVGPVPQPAASLAALEAQVASLSVFHLAAFHDLVAITGSLVLALAIAKDRITEDQAFATSRIDESWQAEQWGEDEEAAAAESIRHAGLRHAAHFFRLVA